MSAGLDTYTLDHECEMGAIHMVSVQVFYRLKTACQPLATPYGMQAAQYQPFFLALLDPGVLLLSTLLTVVLWPWLVLLTSTFSFSSLFLLLCSLHGPLLLQGLNRIITHFP